MSLVVYVIIAALTFVGVLLCWTKLKEAIEQQQIILRELRRQQQKPHAVCGLIKNLPINLLTPHLAVASVFLSSTTRIHASRFKIPVHKGHGRKRRH